VSPPFGYLVNATKCFLKRRGKDSFIWHMDRERNEEKQRRDRGLGNEG